MMKVQQRKPLSGTCEEEEEEEEEEDLGLQKQNIKGRTGLK
jgi:hypothetical protein